MINETPVTWDVIVVGAGPAGATAALLLSRQGFNVLLLDRARFPRDKPCSEYLTPGATRILERLGGGIVEQVERSAHARLYGMKVVSPSGIEMVGRFAGDHPYPPPRPYSFALPRTTFDTILRDAAAAAGAEVWEGVNVEDLAWEGGAVVGVRTRATDSVQRATCNVERATLFSRVVVGADGLNSITARRLGARRRSSPERIAFAAHFTGVLGVGDLGEMHTSVRGYVGMGPIGDGMTTVALVLPRGGRIGGQAGGRMAEAELMQELERFPKLRGRFDAARLVRSVLAVGPFARWSSRVTADGACLVGDAADFFDPFTGQGIYTALRTGELAAEAIGRALARRETLPLPVSRAALAPYARARRAEFAGKWVLERLIGGGVGWPALVERVVPRLARRPQVADLLVGATGNFVPARAVFTPRVLTSLLW